MCIINGGIMLGLALEGGGAKGAFHMGAVKALLEEGYKFDGVVGTSIGAINGAVIAQGDFELGYSWWEKMDISLMFDIDQVHIQNFLDKKIDKMALKYLYTEIKNIIGNKGIDTQKMRKILEVIIDEEKMRKSETDFGIVTVSVSDLKPLELYKEDIPKGKMLEYLMASANFPAFRIEPIDGKFYLDGGFYDNCPINLLIRKGYEEIIAVRTLGTGIVRKIEDENVKVINIIPSQKLGNVLNFDNSIIKRNLKMGYCDAMRSIKNLKGSNYYINYLGDDKSIIYGLASMSNKSIYEIGKMMKLSQIEPKRMLFEKILPNLSKKLGLSSSSAYQDIIVGVLEQMAEKRGIEKYLVRNFNSFLEEIKSVSIEDEKVYSLSRERVFEKAGKEFLKVL